MNRTTLTSLALVAGALPAVAATTSHETTRIEMNVTSRQAVEAAWIGIPPLCKDRSFAFQPVKVGHEAPDAIMQSLFATME